MAQIELRLSSKIQKETGKTEVMICVRYSGHDLSARSGVFVNPSFFEYFVDRKKTINPKKPFPENKQTATREKAEKNGWVLRKSGVITTSNNKLQTPETVYHNTQSARMEDLKKFIIDSFNQETDKDSLTSGWLKSIVDEFHNPKATQNHKSKKSFYVFASEYIEKPHGKLNAPLAKRHQDVFRVLLREVARFEGFVRATDRSRKSFKFDVDTVTKDDIQLFADYLRDEKKLSEQYPTIYKKLIEKYPPTASMKRVRQTIEPRGTNTIIKALTRLKSLFKFFLEKGYTTNNPFLTFNIGVERLGTPVYITIDERNTIAQADLKSGWEQMSNEDKKSSARMTLKTLCEQRDIFVFHCFVGCRVGDLVKLTERNINDGILVYTPHKTRDNGAQAEQARIPLHPKALALVEKYRGIDTKGRLFPFLSAQRYNDAIKLIFRLSGITRNVEIRNPLTGENEWVGIDTIASSHMARRTFIGNAYFKVSDPNLIGKMSGHVDGSRAFRRYRNIEDETLRNVIDQIG